MSGSTTKGTLGSEGEPDPRTKLLKVEVLYADLPDEEQQQLIQFTISAIERHVFHESRKASSDEFLERCLLQRELERVKMIDISRYIKEQADSKIGASWHVIYGRSYATYVTHERQRFMHFQIDEADVVIWKHG